MEFDKKVQEVANELFAPLTTEGGAKIANETVGSTLIDVGYLARSNQYAFSTLRQLVHTGDCLLFSKFQDVLVDELGLVTVKDGKPVVNDEVAAIVKHFEKRWMLATFGID